MTYTGNINDNVSRSMKIPIRFSKEEKFGQKNSLVYYTSFKPDGMSEMDMNNIKALYSQYYGTMTPSRVNFYMPDDKIENCLVCRYFSFTGKGGGAKGDLIAISDGTYFWFLADPNNKHNRLVVNGLINHDLEINGKIYPAGTKLPHMELNFGNRSLTMKYTVSLFVYVKELFDAGCYALAEFRSGTAKDRDTALSALTQYRKLMELQKKTILEFPITAYRAEKATMTPYKKDELISYWQFTPMAKVNPQIRSLQLLKNAKLLSRKPNLFRKLLLIFRIICFQLRLFVLIGRTLPVCLKKISW